MWLFGFSYSVVGFIDKNKDTLFQDFKRLLYNRSVFSNNKSFHSYLHTCQTYIPSIFHSSNPVLKAMWPEGKLSITEVTKRPLTAATLFKNSMISLVEKLASKASLFEDVLCTLSCLFCINALLVYIILLFLHNFFPKCLYLWTINNDFSWFFALNIYLQIQLYYF